MESALEREMKKWEEREQRFREGKVFSEEVLDGPLLKEKLAFLDRLSIQYKPHPGNDHLDFRLLQAERRKIQRRLYPNLIRRLVAKVIGVIKRRQQAATLTTQSAFNEQQLKSSLIRAGFSAHIGKVIDKMKQGRDFTLPVSYYVNEGQRMDYDLSFKRGSHGEFKFESYKATLKQDAGNKKVEQTFKAGISSGFSADQAYHLLSGRSVHNKVSGGAWQQLDFNDTDAEGNYRFKTFPDHYHNVNYQKLLSELPIAPGTGINPNLLIDKMASGEQVAVPLMKDGQVNEYLIQINPQKCEIGIYEKNGSKVDFSSKRESAAESQSIASKKESQSKRRIQKIS